MPEFVFGGGGGGFFFGLFRAMLTACGSSHAGGLTGAAATGVCHSNTGSKPRL